MSFIFRKADEHMLWEATGRQFSYREIVEAMKPANLSGGDHDIDRVVHSASSLIAPNAKYAPTATAPLRRMSESQGQHYAKAEHRTAAIPFPPCKISSNIMRGSS